MDTITFDDFIKADMRVGVITRAEPVEKSKKLLKLEVNFGTEIGVRTIMAGIAEHYNADGVIGMPIVAIVNLPPRTMMGVESNGMLLAGKSVTGQVMLVSPNGIAVGERIG